MTTKKNILEVLPMKGLKVSNKLELIVTKEFVLDRHCREWFLDEIPFSVPKGIRAVLQTDPFMSHAGIITTSYPMDSNHKYPCITVLNMSDRTVRFFEGDVLGCFIVSRELPLEIKGGD